MLVYPDMHNAFRLNLDKSSSLVGNPDFLPEEIDFWLNDAQTRFIKQRMFGNNDKHEGFEQGIKRLSDLQTLICNTLQTFFPIPSGYMSIPLISSKLGNNVVENSWSDSYYDPFMYFLDATLYSNGTTPSYSIGCGETISTKDLVKYIQDSLNSPFIRRPLVYMYNNITTTSTTNHKTIAFIYDSYMGWTPSQYSMLYIKKPRPMTSGNTTIGDGYLTNICELPEEVHSEIVNIAVSLAIENTESARVQTFTPLNKSNIE
jgi:hypothetical protein